MFVSAVIQFGSISLPVIQFGSISLPVIQFWFHLDGVITTSPIVAISSELADHG
jgi:hypothetical protein